jgi:guanylate kinase
MNNIIFLVGNYGVGKSSIIKEPILSQQEFLIEIKPSLYVLGDTIAGADSLSPYPKNKVVKTLLNHRDKNIIIAGIYYTTKKDILFLSKYFNVTLIYLKTSFEENAKRIALRGNQINIDTYNSKLKSHYSLIKGTKGFRKLFIVDNNRSLNEVKEEVYKIIEDETTRTNASTPRL